MVDFIKPTGRAAADLPVGAVELRVTIDDVSFAGGATPIVAVPVKASSGFAPAAKSQGSPSALEVTPLVQALSARWADAGSRELTLRADARIPFRILAEIAHSARSAGGKGVALVVTRPSGGEGAVPLFIDTPTTKSADAGADALDAVAPDESTLAKAKLVAGPCPRDERLDPTVEIVDVGYVVHARGKRIEFGCDFAAPDTVPIGAQDAGVGPTVPKDTGQYDAGRLTRCLEKLRTWSPCNAHETRIELRPGPELSTQNLVNAIEATQATRDGHPLFTDIVLAP